MTQSKIKSRQPRKQLIVDNSLVTAIADSQNLNEKEKLLFLRYAGYYTADEREELKQLI